MIVSSSWQNPYIARLKEFPEQLLRLDDAVADRQLMAQILATHERSVVEFGSGSGAHLLELARRNPKAAVIGFEIRYKRAVRTIEKAQRAAIRNCFVVRGSYDRALELLPMLSVDRLYVNFPDPWAKKRWFKHRILGPRLFAFSEALLTAQGRTYVKTDHHEYFRSFVEELRRASYLQLLEYSEDLFASEYAEKTIATEFENLFRGQGLPIYYASFSRALTTAA